MAILLDSANLEEAKAIARWGWVKGITTNPTILAKSNLPPEKVLQHLADISPGELYYQLTSSDFEGMVAEARQAYQLIGKKLVLKIPATAVGFEFAASVSGEIPCSITAIYSAAQAAVAREVGAKYAIAYVNRATRLLGDGMALVREMAAVLQGSPTEILAASLKSPEEAAGAIQAGATHLTLPFEGLKALTVHPLSEQTVVEFLEAGCGIRKSGLSLNIEH